MALHRDMANDDTGVRQDDDQVQDAVEQVRRMLANPRRTRR